MRTSTAHAPRAPFRRGRALQRTAVTVAALLVLAGCGADDDDEALTDAGVTEDLPVGEDGTGGEPLPDVPGVTGAEPADDVRTSADPDGDVATARVPPLLEEIDGWPEATVTLDDEVAFEVKVAADRERRAQGLMNVPELPEGVGMLFLFDEPSSGGFWMKNTLVPLDIAYILDDEVVAVLQMDPCEADPCPSYDPETEYDAALEVEQGALADAGVDAGSTVTWTEPVEVAPA
jgi:uncharacterized protein